MTIKIHTLAPDVAAYCLWYDEWEGDALESGLDSAVETLILSVNVSVCQV